MMLVECTTRAHYEARQDGGRGGDNCKPQEIEGIFTYLSLIVVDPAGDNTQQVIFLIQAKVAVNLTDRLQVTVRFKESCFEILVDDKQQSNVCCTQNEFY